MQAMVDRAPLIVTLAMDTRSFALFQEARQRHFPPERNLIPAHLTLFHALPGAEIDAVSRDLLDIGRAQAPFTLDVIGLRSLGRGVAYELEAAPLRLLRDRLAARWAAWLGPQDRQKHRPHVTVQNKVDPSAARALLAELQAGFQPFTVEGEGLHLWRYRGGPWEPVDTVLFAGDRPAIRPWR
jgi:2'-5' RNA ligase